MVSLFVWPPFWYIHQHNNKNNDTEATEVNGEEPQEPVREFDEEIDVVEAFKVCHTSRKKGTSDAAREAVGSPYTWFLDLLGFS